MENISSCLCLREPTLTRYGNRWMPVSLNEAMKRIFRQRLGFFVEWKVIVNCFSEDIGYFFHFTVFIGRDIDKETRMNLPSLKIFEPVH
jgi:alanine-alpha-ketoisovalerate/valine-pyruvate aminotransferase